MNIIKEQKNNLSMQLKLSIDELDYRERVKKELNKLRVKAQMPGFRQGHVPFGLVQKMYGQSVLVEEINKILQENVGKFLEEEKIDLLGAPFPAPDSPTLDFEYEKEFNFILNVILSPEVNIDFLPTLSTTYYKIKATDAVIDEQITALRQRFGTKEPDSETVIEAELNEALFSKVFPHKEIKTEKDFRKAIAEEHSAMCAETVAMWFFNTCFDPIIKAANVQYDDEMLRQFMEHQKRVHPEERQQEEEEPVSDDYTISDEEFVKTRTGTSWQLIQQKLMTTYDIKVEADEIKQEAKVQISRYFGVDPKMMESMGEYMNGMVDNLMKDKNQVHELYNRVLDRKMTQLLIEKTQTTTKEVTWDEFLTIIDAKKEKTDAAPKKTRRSPAPKSKKEKSE